MKGAEMRASVGIIGLGGIGSTIAAALQSPDVEDRLRIAGVCVKSRHLDAARRQLKEGIPLFDRIENLLGAGPDVIVESAGHEAVGLYGERILDFGIDLVLISTGALANEELLERLRRAASRTGARIYLPAGALGGIDALRAAVCAGVTTVRYRGRKPPVAWKGTPAEEVTDLDALRTARSVYRGNARAAALQYPKNSNVAAIVALAGIGFDASEVELIADPDITENQHEIEVQAVTGTFRICMSGRTLADSPKTSALAAYSVVRCLINRVSEIVF